MATAELPQTTALVVPPIGPECAGISMSPEEFDAIEEYDEGYRYELVRGVLVVTPVPLEEEAGHNDSLGYLMLDYRKKHPLGRSLDATLPERYIRTAEGRRRADRVAWAGLGRQPNPKVDVPTIAVEFVSGGKRDWTRDYVAKRREYLDAGVVEYWIFDRFRRTLTVYRNPPAVETTVLAETGIYQTPLLPGFELSIAEVLQAADAWRDPS